MAVKKHECEKKRPDRSFDSTHESLQIVRLAALCFAVVSWFATAEGMNLYIFQDQPVHAALVSFGVQGLLFVFNLKLPAYFKRIGVEESEKSGGRAKHINSSWGYKAVLLILYCATLAFSSTFSFVFICNNAVYGSDIGYVDNNIALNSSYWDIRKTTQDYINESIKASQIIASEQLSELQTMVGDLFAQSTGEQKTLTELTVALETAEDVYNIAVLEEEQKERDYVRANDEVQKLEGVRFWLDEDYAAAVQKRDEAYGAWKEAERNLLEKEKVRDKAQHAVENWDKTEGAVVGGFLAELLSLDPDPSTLKAKLNDLNQSIIQLGNDGNIPSNYGDIVTQTQALQITVEQYLVLRTAANDEVFSSTNNALSDTISNAPNPQLETFEADKEAWQANWKTVYDDMKNLIQTLPVYSDSNAKYLQRGDEGYAINFVILASYNPIWTMQEIDNLLRENATDINTVEKVIRLFWSAYPATAIISATIAYFLDLASLGAGLFQYAIIEAEKERLRKSASQ